MAISPCPDHEKLHALLVGTLDEQELDTIATHLGDCPVCRAVLEGMGEPSDTLISRLRGLSGEPTAPLTPHETALDRLLAKAGALVDAAGGRQPATVGGAGLPNQLGDYRLLEKLGEGGMGAVYKAEHVKLKRIVALKVVPPNRMRCASALLRFQREMEALGRLNHPNVIRAHDARETDGVHFLVMEYIEGFTLSELVARRGPLPIAEACELIRQAAVGLQSVHEFGLVHRDIKPSNLMLAAGGQPADTAPALGANQAQRPCVKILDLGLVLLLGQELLADGDLTGSGQIAGTIDYMAPEQCDDSHGVDIRADIFSLGITMHKLLVGEPPLAEVGGNMPLKKLAALASEDVRSLAERCPRVPAALAAVVDRMTARDPRDRFATPAEVAVALEPFCAGADLSRLLAPDALGDTNASPTQQADETGARWPAAASKAPHGDAATEPMVDGNPPQEATDAAEASGQSTAGLPGHPRRSLPSVFLGVLLLAAVVGGLVAGAVVIRIKNRQGEEVAELTVTDGYSVEGAKRPGSSAEGEQGRTYMFPPEVAPGTEQSPTKAAALAADSEAGCGPWEELFDGKTLAGWTPFPADENARVVNGQILLGNMDGHARLLRRGQLPETNYEIALDVQRLAGERELIGLTFLVGEQQASLSLSVWGGHPAALLRVVDGQKTVENPTLRRISIVNERWYPLRLRVTPARIRFLFDGATLIDFPVPGHTFDPQRHYFSLPLAIMTSQARVALRGIRFRRLEPTRATE